MAQFAVLLFSPAPADPLALPEDELAEHEKLAGKPDELGVKIVDAWATAPSTGAKTVRTGGEVVDGPFTGELVVSGFFIVEADSIDQVVELARVNPATWRGAAEVRPLFEPPAE